MLALGLSGAFLFLIYRGASAESDEREVNKTKKPYQILEVFNNGQTGQTFVGSSDKVKLQDIAQEIGAAPYAEDRLSDFPGFRDFYGQRITLYRAPSYIVYDQNKETTYRSFASAVGELLSEKKIVLGVDDKINFSSDTKLDEGMIVKITRVAKTKVIETEKIEYKTTKQNDSTLDKGKTKVKQAGVLGERKLTYEVTRENGVEISKILLTSEVTKEATGEILLVGTKITLYGDGKATWYVDTTELIAACNIVPKGTIIHVVNSANGKSVDVKVVDRIGNSSAVIDLSTSAFRALGASLGQGTISNVRLEKTY